jgi:hypothetical protein
VTLDANEQQAVDQRHIDLAIEVVSQTQEVNKNLGAILNRTDTVIRRQNWLTVLFIVLLTLNIVQLGLGFAMQQLQQSAKAQLIAVDYGRQELTTAVEGAKHEVQALREGLVVVKTQLQSVPTVTTDNKGRINLEVPLDTATQKTVSEQPRVNGDTRAPDRLVIPLRPSQSRLAN